MNKKLGAFYQVFRNKKAADFVLKNFRNNFLDSPIVLISDGGDDFEDIAEKYNAIYTKKNNIFGGSSSSAYLDSERMIESWNRHKLTVDICNSDYVMILEDDVLVQDKIELTERFSMKGVMVGNKIPELLKTIVKDASGSVSDEYGMCGGSVYNSEDFLKCYLSAIDFTKKEHDNIFNFQDKIIGAFDLNLVFHFNRCGFRYEKAPWLSEVMRQSDWKNYPIVHQFKEFYR